MGFNPRDFLILLIAICAGALIFGSAFVSKSYSEKTIQEYALEIVKLCEGVSYAPLCYDQEVPKLIDHGLSLGEVFEVVQLIQEKDTRYYYCHVLGHNISAKEAAKDPSRWFEIIRECPVGQCSNGCLHGAFQERFRDETVSDEELVILVPQLKTVCSDSGERTFTSLERASCHHALGHLAMYVTKADVAQSITLCNEIAFTDDVSYVRSCYDGVFMQVFQPLEPEDFALVGDIAPDTQEESRQLCNEFIGDAKEACVRESWPLFLEDIKTSDGALDFCKPNESAEGFTRCFNTVMYVLTAHFEFNEERLEAVCQSFEGIYKAQCYANVASRLIEIDDSFFTRASGFCERAENAGVGERCWKELLFYSVYSTTQSSERFVAFCNALPSPWSTKCLSGEGNSISLYDL